ncbi:MAG: ferrous iron transport protein A [Ignavibacteria bacterium]|nr:ferrous iron transport protein A [Ignavibacteria bacterium]MBL7992176.1 ferrous iron transport protein A [Candidatus Kapabacteria bacterium]
MNEIPVGSKARIVNYTQHDSFTERLREFGLTPGTIIRLLRKAPFNGPVEIQFRSSRIVLRPNEVTHMLLERIA